MIVNERYLTRFYYASMVIVLVVAIMFVAVQPVSADPPYEGAPGARSVMVGGELFLGGNYIELGISAWGDFGTVGARPENFYGTDTRSNIGMSVDHDGFNHGYDYRADYFLPGSPEERFAVGYKVGEVTHANSNCPLCYVEPNTAMPTTITDQSSGDLLEATVVSTWEGTMEITQVISFTVNQKFFRNEVTLKNISGTAWDGARYMRTFDPDNTWDVSGEYVTDNTVTHTIAEDDKAVVKAETWCDDDLVYLAFDSRAPIFLYSTDPAAVASVFGFYNLDPYESEAYDDPHPKGETWRADVAITMTWDSGPLDIDESRTFVYYTSLDERDFEEVEEEIATTLTIDSSQGGSVTTPGEGDPVGTYDQGDVVHLVAAPDTGYHFVNWTGDTGEIANVNEASTTITMEGDYSITANFEDIAAQCIQTATDTGSACVTPSHGTMEDLLAVPAVSPAPRGVSFPHGMFEFEITGLDPGETVNVTIELPQPVPEGTVWWKHDGTRWYSLPNLNDNNVLGQGDNIMVIELTDGGLGDADGVADGTIVDPGGPGNPVPPLTVGWEGSPVNRLMVMAPWIALGAIMMAGATLLVVRRRRAQVQV